MKVEIQKKTTDQISVGLIWASPHTGNLGVTALAFSALLLFEKLSEHLGVKFNYFLLATGGPRREVFQIYDREIEVTNLPWAYTGSFRSLIKLSVINWYQVLNLFKLDIVFDVGAGDSYSDIYGIERFRQIDSIKVILHLLGRRFILLPQTFGPFNSLEARTKATRSIKKASLVCSRDLQSTACIKDLVPDQKICESIDMAFFMPFNRNEINSSAKLKVGINVSGLLWNGGYTRNNQFGLKVDYQELIKGLIDFFSRKSDVEIFLVGHVLLTDYDNVENDYKVNEELNKLYPEVKVAPFFKDPISAKSFIAGLDFFTGARMHACIAAFSSEVPVFPLAYSRKFNGLFGETLNYPYYGDLTKSDNSQIMRDLEWAFENKNELKRFLSVAKTSIIQKEQELLEQLADAFSRKK